MRTKLDSSGVGAALRKRFSRGAFARPARRAVRKCLEMIADDARSLAPVRSGDLRDSIEVEIDPGGTSGRVVAGRDGWPQDYAISEEYGSVDQAAQPFLRPAVDHNRDRVPQILTAEIAASLKG